MATSFVLDELRAEHEKNVEKSCLRARARRLTHVSRLAFFAASFILFMWGMLLPNRNLDPLSLPARAATKTNLAGSVLGSAAGGVLLDRRGWFAAIAAASAALFVGSLLLTATLASAVAEMQNATTVTELTPIAAAFFVQGEFIAGLGVGAMYPVAGVLALAREKAGGHERSEARVAKTFAMQWVGISALLLLRQSVVPVLQAWGNVALGIAGSIVALLPIFFAASSRSAFKPLELQDPHSSRAERCSLREHMRALAGSPAIRRAFFSIALSWFLFDLVYYGLNSYEFFVDRHLEQLGFTDRAVDPMAQVGSLSCILTAPGYLLGWLALRSAARTKGLQTKWIQVVTCAVLCILVLSQLVRMLVTGDDGDGDQPGAPFPTAAIILDLLIFTLLNGGPNTTIFVLTSSTAPREGPGTFVGLASAAGKLGATVGHLLFQNLVRHWCDKPGRYLIFEALLQRLSASPAAEVAPSDPDEAREMRVELWQYSMASVTFTLIAVVTAVLVRRPINALGRTRRHSPFNPAGADDDELDRLGDSHLNIPRERLLVGELVGAGGQGRVKVARYDGQLVCVKEVFSGIGDVQIFLREVEFLQKLSHPNIVRFFGVSMERTSLEAAPSLLLVTEWAAGGSMVRALHHAAAESGGEGASRLGDAVVLRWATEVCAALCHLHERLMVHLDLKPENVLLSQGSPASAIAMVCDFGLSRVLHSDSITAELVGSTRYVAPEMMLATGTALQARVDARKVDVFSFGISLYYMLTLAVPWDALALAMPPLHAEPTSVKAGPEPPRLLTAVQIFRECTRGNRPRLPESVPKPLRDMYAAAVDPNPSLRPSFQQLVQKLESYRVDSGCFVGPSIGLAELAPATRADGANCTRSGFDERSFVTLGINSLPKRDESKATAESPGNKRRVRFGGLWPGPGAKQDVARPLLAGGGSGSSGSSGSTDPSVIGRG